MIEFKEHDKKSEAYLLSLANQLDVCKSDEDWERIRKAANKVIDVLSDKSLKLSIREADFVLTFVLYLSGVTMELHITKKSQDGYIR